MVLKSILSPQVLNINDEEHVFIKTIAAFLAVLVDVKAMSRLTFFCFLDACCAALRALSSPHIFQAEHPQQ